jgi:hypothetical protein
LIRQRQGHGFGDEGNHYKWHVLVFRRQEPLHVLYKLSQHIQDQKTGSNGITLVHFGLAQLGEALRHKGQSMLRRTPLGKSTQALLIVHKR